MSIRIVVAEDSSYQRKIITNMIDSQEGMEVVAIARNGMDALEKVEKFDPDVLILDLEMPKMTGLEAFEFLSEHYLVPTIIFSSSDPKTLDFETQAILLGAVDYLKKPGVKGNLDLPKIEKQLIEKILIASKMNKSYKKLRDPFRKALIEFNSSLKKKEKAETINKVIPPVEKAVKIENRKLSSARTENIRIIVAEDSAFQRKIISGMISSREGMEVVATARNGREALEKVEKFNPDVLILDLIMPEMTGLEVFEILSEHYPVPTIVFSSLDPKTLDSGIQALLLGAVDYIMKPGGEWNIELPKFKEQLIEKIILASRIQKNYTIRRDSFQNAITEQKSLLKKKVKDQPVIEVIPPVEIKPRKPSRIKTNIIVMGASVGGPKTLKAILSQIPEDFSIPILIVQHMNAFFMEQFAQSLNNTCKLSVKIPKDGEIIKPKTIYLAPGAKHMEIVFKDGKPCLHTFKGEPVNFCIPAVDVLFLSAANVYQHRVLGILLTGMGADGVNGLEKIRKNGGRTIAESKETCILYGMPKIAADRGVADIIVPNYEVKNHMIKHSKL